jgi:hypothetical protein
MLFEAVLREFGCDESDRHAPGYLKTFEQSNFGVMQEGLGQLRDILEVVAQVGEEAADPK